MLMHRFDLKNNGNLVDSVFVLSSEYFDPSGFPPQVGAFDVEYVGEVEVNGS